MELREILYRFIYDDEGFKKDMDRLDTTLRRTKQDSDEAGRSIEKLYDTLSQPQVAEAEIDDNINDKIIVGVDFEFNDIPEVNVNSPDIDAMTNKSGPQPEFYETQDNRIDTDVTQNDIQDTNVTNVLEDNSIANLSSQMNLESSAIGTPDISADSYQNISNKYDNNINSDISGEITENDTTIDNNYLNTIESKVSSALSQVINNEVEQELSSVNNTDINSKIQQNYITGEGADSIELSEIYNKISSDASANIELEDADMSMEYGLNLSGSIELNDPGQMQSKQENDISDTINRTEQTLEYYNNSMNTNINSNFKLDSKLSLDNNNSVYAKLEENSTQNNLISNSMKVKDEKTYLQQSRTDIIEPEKDEFEAIIDEVVQSIQSLSTEIGGDSKSDLQSIRQMVNERVKEIQDEIHTRRMIGL